MRRAVAAGAILLFLTSCSSSGDDTNGPVSIAAQNAARAPLLPTDVLALPGTSFERFQQLLEQLHGTPLVVNVWGSWCGPCRVEGPHFADAARRYGGRVQFLGVDDRDDRGSARAFIREMGWTYPSLFDPTESIKTGLGFLGVPDTLFFDASGKRVAVSSGPLTPDDLQAGIQKILG